MATIGEVNAKGTDTESKGEVEGLPYMLYFGVFFDGTSNNMIQKEAAKRIKQKQIRQLKKESGSRLTSQQAEKHERLLLSADEISDNFSNGANRTVDLNGKEGVNKSDTKGYSNVGILHSLYQGMPAEEYPTDYNVKIYNVYVEGSGANVIMGDSTSERNMVGIAFGKGKTGVAYLTSKALELVLFRIKTIFNTIPRDLQHKTIVKFDVFGFSRGATCSRLFSYCVASDNETLTESDLPCVKELRNSYLSAEYIDGDNIRLFKPTIDIKKKNITVEMLGIFDTVSSIGGIRLDSYRNNTRDYGLYSPSLKRVKHAFHICAMDEFRAHFALTDLGAAVTRHGEIFIPGCHSDVGGGYINSNATTGPESFKVPYALKAVKKSPWDNDREPVHFQIAKSHVSRPDRTIDFIRYLRNYGFLGPTDDASYDSRSNCLWGNINDCTLIKAFGLVNADATVQRPSIAGYSNIPLEIMTLRSKADSGRELFRSHKGLFDVSSDILKIFGGQGKLKELSEVKGKRQFYYPGGSWDSDSYKALRKYLHFSGEWYAGNDIYYNGGTVRRIVYYGDRAESSMHFYQEYNL